MPAKEISWAAWLAGVLWLDTDAITFRTNYMRVASLDVI